MKVLIDNYPVRHGAGSQHGNVTYRLREGIRNGSVHE